MKVTPIDTSNLKTIEDISRFSSINFANIISAINGGLSFADNLSASIVSATFTSANVNTTIFHTLNKVPSWYFPIQLSAAMSIYDGSVASTTNNITLKSSTVGSATMVVF